jgi:cardiolipin synthase
VADLEEAFLNDWDYCGGSNALREEIRPSTPVETHEGGDVAARLVLDGPNEDLDKLNDILGGVISGATRRVWIMTPYFLPDAELIGILQAASLRNVDVKIVLPAQNNIPFVDWATRHLMWQLLYYGIEVYYQAPPFSHSKLLVVDELYSLVGSANLDPRSLRLNFELSLEIFSAATNAALDAYFTDKLKSARRYTIADRSGRSLPVRLRDAAAWLFSPYL